MLEQFKKEDYGSEMREWISKLILINEIEAAEDLLKKAEKKVDDFNDYLVANSNVTSKLDAEEEAVNTCATFSEL
jgi:hypothetical protein